MKAIFWAGVGTLFPFAMTVLGAALVFLFRDSRNGKTEQVCMGFAAGVMSAAAVFSMILPAMRQNEGGWLIVTLGFMLGAAMIAGVDALMCRVRRIQNASDSARKRLMMVAAITLHNIPEGMAVGVVYAGYLSGQAQITAAGALALSLGIAIQNFPEGAIISMPLHAEGMGKGRAFADGVLSGIVEPIGAVLTVLAARMIVPALPYLLSFAAGAMLYVVVEELIPEMSQGRHSNIGTICFALGFGLMMVLDVALG